MRRSFLLQRYVIAEFLPPFFLGLLIFTFLLVLNNLFLMMDLFLNRGVEIQTIAYMMVLVLPMFLPLSLPMSALLAAMMAYGRLAEEGELTALRSSGCALAQYARPNIILGLILSLFLVFLNQQVIPRITLHFKDLYFVLAQSNPLSLFAPKLMNQFGDYKIYVDQMDRRKKQLSSISIYRNNAKGGPTRIFAANGLMHNAPGQGLTLVLLNGSLHQPNSQSESNYTITRFNRLELFIPPQNGQEKRLLSPKEMTSKQLHRAIVQAPNPKEAAPFKTEFHFRNAIAFAPFVFIILGIAIGARVRRSSRSISIGSSLLIVLLYYGVLMFMTSLSTQAIAHSALLVWLANAITFVVGIVLYKNLQRQ